MFVCGCCIVIVFWFAMIAFMSCLFKLCGFAILLFVWASFDWCLVHTGILFGLLIVALVVVVASCLLCFV